MAKDHARDRKKPFYAKIKVSTFANLEVHVYIYSRLFDKEKKKEEDNREIRGLAIFCVSL